MRSIVRCRALAWNSRLNRTFALVIALVAGLVLIRLSPLSGLLLVGGGVVAVGTLIEPLVGLAAALFLGPLWAYVGAEVPQIPAQIAQPVVVLTLASWLAQGLARRELRIPNPLGGRKATPLLLPLLVFFGAALLSLWDAVELPVYGVPELLKWAQILLLFLFVSQHLTPRRLPWLVGALLAIGLFQAGVGIWQFGLRGEGPEHFAILDERFYRAYGTFEQPNPYAGYLGMTLSLAVGSVWGVLSTWLEGKRTDDRGDRGSRPLLQGNCICLDLRGLVTHLFSKYVSLPVRAFGKTSSCKPRKSTMLPISRLLPLLLVSSASAVAMLVALGMSWSRGAWLGFGAAALAMAAALPRKMRWGLLLVAVLIVGGIGLYASGRLPASAMDRLTDFIQDVRFEDVRGKPINDASFAVIERLAHWQTALAMFRHNFWTGVGFGCYAPAYAGERHPLQFALINWPLALGHAHNYYLNLAAETGLIGLIAYLLLWGAVFWQTWRVTRRAHGLTRGIAIGLLGAWTHLSVHHLLDNLYVNNVHLHVGVLLGLLAWLVRSCQTPQSSL